MVRSPAFTTALAAAPPTPGVYFFFGDNADLLYVGKARDLRQRLRQHDQAKPTGRAGRLRGLYERVREVRWEPLADEETAAAREADLIVALQPPFNASHSGEGRWVYITVRAQGQHLLFALTNDGDCPGGRAYGCFPHLGRGVSSRPAIACSDGYTAFLRLLWAASGEPGGYPRRISGPSPPDTFETHVDPVRRPSLHAFLSGTSTRVLAELAVAARDREPYMQPALQRGRAAAELFFTYGPKAIRGLRLRHKQPAGPLAKTVITELLTAELRDRIGDFRIPVLRDPTEGLIGSRASKVATIATVLRNGQPAQ